MRAHRPPQPGIEQRREGQEVARLHSRRVKEHPGLGDQPDHQRREQHPQDQQPEFVGCLAQSARAMGPEEPDRRPPQKHRPHNQDRSQVALHKSGDAQGQQDTVQQEDEPGRHRLLHHRPGAHAGQGQGQPGGPEGQRRTLHDEPPPPQGPPVRPAQADNENVQVLDRQQQGREVDGVQRCDHRGDPREF
ncbi:MAG: hypothetical protein ACK4WK_00835 [Anaerolineae bacterium]